MLQDARMRQDEGECDMTSQLFLPHLCVKGGVGEATTRSYSLVTETRQDEATSLILVEPTSVAL